MSHYLRRRLCRMERTSNWFHSTNSVERRRTCGHSERHWAPQCLLETELKPTMVSPGGAGIVGLEIATKSLIRYLTPSWRLTTTLSSIVEVVFSIDRPPL